MDFSDDEGEQRVLKYYKYKGTHTKHIWKEGVGRMGINYFYTEKLHSNE